MSIGETILVFSKLIVVLSGMMVGSALFASTSYVEALQCHSRFVEDFGEANAALLCRCVESRNATAVYNCVSEGKARTDDGKPLHCSAKALINVSRQQH